jgi:3-oxoacyl-[acyl-carrier protein] reductase
VTGEAPLAGRVVALIGSGSELDRAIAVACAEAGAGIALGSVEKSREQEYALNSIANEVWVIGRDQCVRAMDATHATDVTSFADEVCDGLGRVDVLVANHDLVSTAEFDELSPDEWERSLAVNLTGPYLAAQAFGRLMERAGAGLLLLVALEREGCDASYTAAKTGLRGLAGHVEAAWGGAGVHVRVLQAAPGEPVAVARQVVAAIAEAMRA